MINFNLDTTVFLIFLAATILLGIFSSHGIKSIREYAVGDRNFSTATIAATLVATWGSGQTFFTILSETYSSGLYFIWSVLGYILCLLSIGMFFAPRMGEFLGKLSVAEAMGDLFGRNVRVITAIAGFVASGGMIALQLKVSGFLFEYCFGINEIYGIIIGGIIVTFYSSLGGIKSVTFTDVIQLITFSTMIPTLALFILGTADNIEILTNTLSTHQLFNYQEVFDFSRPQSLYFVFLFLFNAIPAFNPAFFQRIAMAKDTKQVGRSFVIAAFTCLFITLTISFISILILSIEPGLNSNDLTKYILSNYSYPGLQGFILAGIMAMVMSTADSYVNSTSILLVNDFCKPLGIKIVKDDLLFSRIASALLGILSIGLAMRSGSLLELIIATNCLYMPIVTVPFIFAMLGFRASGKSVLTGMAAGFISVVIWESFFKSAYAGIDGLIPGMVMNTVFLLGSHYLLNQPGGWVGIKDTKPLREMQEYRSARAKEFIQSIKDFNLFSYLHKNSPNSEGIYVYLGLFCIISLYSTMYTIPKSVRLEYIELINIISPSVLFMATALLSYPLWLDPWKRSAAISVIWNVVAFYVLICVGFLFVIISGFAPFQVMLLIINLILVAVLTRWQWALLIMLIGFIVTTWFADSYLPAELWQTGALSLQLKIIYLLLLITSFLVVFLKPKQEQYALSEEKNEHLSGRIELQESELRHALALKQEFIRNVTHEYNAPMTGIISMAEAAYAYRNNLSKDELADAMDTIYKSALRLNNFDSNISTLAKLSKAGFELNKEHIDLSSLVLERAETCRKLYEDAQQEDRKFIFNIAKGVEVFADRYYLMQTLDNLIINAITYCQKGDIIIELECDKAKSEIKFTITDDGIGIPRSELYDIFDEFKVSSKTHTPAGGRGVGLAVAKKVIEAHGGKISADSDGERGASFEFVLSAAG